MQSTRLTSLLLNIFFVCVVHIENDNRFLMLWSRHNVFLIGGAFELEGAGHPKPCRLAQGLRGRCHGEPITHSLQTCFGALFDNYSCLPILSELHPGLEGSTSDGHLTSGTEPFCGRFSLHQPRHLALTPPAAQKVYRLDQYTHVSSSHGVCRPGG